MINQKPAVKQNNPSFIAHEYLFIIGVIIISFLLTSCGPYSFHDVSIDYKKIKTARVNFLDNKARYISPQLSPKLTDALRQRISNYTKLTLTNSDDANYQISGFINKYDVTVSAIGTNNTATNRLTVGAHIIFTNTVDNKTDEFNVTKDFDFPATNTLQQQETNGTFYTDMINQLTDQIFNHIFSNW